MQNAEHRGRVPRDTAELMLGTTDPTEVVSSIGELADFCYDIHDLMDRVPDIVDRALPSENAVGGVPRLGPKLDTHLDGLAFETWVASFTCYAATSEIPGAAVFIWACRICLYEEYYGIGLITSLQGLSDAVTLCPEGQQLAELLQPVCLWAVSALDWDEAFDFLPLLAYTCVASGRGRKAMHRTFLDRVRTCLGKNNGPYPLKMWWDDRKGRLDPDQRKIAELDHRTEPMNPQILRQQEAAIEILEAVLSETARLAK